MVVSPYNLLWKLFIRIKIDILSSCFFLIFSSLMSLFHVLVQWESIKASLALFPTEEIIVCCPTNAAVHLCLTSFPSSSDPFTQAPLNRWPSWDLFSQPFVQWFLIPDVWDRKVQPVILSFLFPLYICQFFSCLCVNNLPLCNMCLHGLTHDMPSSYIYNVHFTILIVCTLICKPLGFMLWAQ